MDIEIASPSSAPKAKEIVIGSARASGIDKTDLDGNGYEIKVDGDKVFIDSASDEGLYLGAVRFALTCSNADDVRFTSKTADRREHEYAIGKLTINGNDISKYTVYYPANQNLYYYIGVCAGYLAKSELTVDANGENSRRAEYLKLSEAGYLRAIELEPRYARALYGIGVLYTFDLNKPEKAVPYLEKLLTIETRHTEGMFVLARAYYMNYEFQLAVDMYDRIIQTTTSEKSKADAEANKKVVLDAMYSK